MVLFKNLEILIINAFARADIKSKLMHNFIPILTCSASEQENNSNSNLLEIVFISDILLMHSETKEIDTQSSIDEDHQKHERNEIGDWWNNVHQGIKNDLNVLLRSDQSYDSHNSEGSNNSGRSRDARSSCNHVKNDTCICTDNHNAIKDVPSGVEVLRAQSNELKNHFDVEDSCKDVIHSAEELNDSFINTIKFRGHDNGV